MLLLLFFCTLQMLSFETRIFLAARSLWTNPFPERYCIPRATCWEKLSSRLANLGDGLSPGLHMCINIPNYICRERANQNSLDSSNCLTLALSTRGNSLRHLSPLTEQQVWSIILQQISHDFRFHMYFVDSPALPCSQFHTRGPHWGVWTAPWWQPLGGTSLYSPEYYLGWVSSGQPSLSDSFLYSMYLPLHSQTDQILDVLWFCKIIIWSAQYYWAHWKYILLLCLLTELSFERYFWFHMILSEHRGLPLPLLAH